MDDPRQSPEADLTLTEGGPDPAPELFTEGRLTSDQARAIFDRAAELLQSGDYRDAGVHGIGIVTMCADWNSRSTCSSRRNTALRPSFRR